MKKSLAALAAISLLLLSACGAGADDDPDVLSVVASFYPLQFVVEQVGGDLVSVDNLTAPGAEAHDLELKPQQVAEVQDAELVVYAEGFQAAVDDAVGQADRDADTTVEVTSVVDLLESTEAGHDHEEEGHAEEEGHDHGTIDPHLWLDPTNMVDITAAVEESLSASDPDNADTYRANAEALTSELMTLDSEFEAGLATCTTTSFVTSHAAFAYLANRYGLEQIPIAGLDPSNEPTSGQLGEITELVRDEGISTIFTEELVSPAIAQTVADETGAATATLDPIEGLSDDTQDETYLTLMRTNLAALEKANGCS